MTKDELVVLLDAYAECAVDDMYETDRGSQNPAQYKKIDDKRGPILRRLLEGVGIPVCNHCMATEDVDTVLDVGTSRDVGGPVYIRLCLDCRI